MTRETRHEVTEVWKMIDAADRRLMEGVNLNEVSLSSPENHQVWAVRDLHKVCKNLLSRLQDLPAED